MSLPLIWTYRYNSPVLPKQLFFRELAEILRREIRLGGTDDEVIALQFRLGQLFEQSLSDIDSALEVYREILLSDPNHSPTIAALELLFAEGQRWR